MKILNLYILRRDHIFTASIVINLKREHIDSCISKKGTHIDIGCDACTQTFPGLDEGRPNVIKFSKYIKSQGIFNQNNLVFCKHPHFYYFETFK